MTAAPRLFASFFLGGFECATHVTAEGHRLDLIAASQHDCRAREDYALVRSAGICTVREAVRWPVVDRGGALDLSGPRELARVGRAAGVTQIWDLMHYGYPDDLDPFSERFAERFAAYARAAAEVVRAESEGPIWFTPINEISYFTWSATDAGYMAPFAHGRGGALKRALVRAAIAGTNAIWEVDPAARILNVDPLVHVHVPPDRPDLAAEAERFNGQVIFEAFDMLAGRLHPELGGSRAHLGVVGLNYYALNQWVMPTPERPQRFLRWDDPVATPLSALLEVVQSRYGGPLVLAELGSWADDRAGFMDYVAREAERALRQGIDLAGICLYPIVSTPDWDDPTACFDGGLFDITPRVDGALARTLDIPFAAALRRAQRALDPENLPADPLPEPPPPCPEPPVRPLRPDDCARFKQENFSYQVLMAGDSLQVELYGFEPGAQLYAHRHEATEHVLTILRGEGEVRVGGREITLQAGESLLVPAGHYHGIRNRSSERLLVQQVSAPRPWDARFGGPAPAGWSDGPIKVRRGSPEGKSPGLGGLGFRHGGQ